jgi:DNA-nicking Smr family endonuclease
MSTRKKPSPEDIALFRRSVGQVRKVRHDKIGTTGKPPAPRPRFRLADNNRNATADLSDGFDAGEVAADDYLFFTSPGVQRRQLQRLRRGQLPIGAELDMHGLTTAGGRDELVEFIGRSRNRQIRCIRIIHGKGYGSRTDRPVLKNRLNTWLRQHPDVLAFCSAPVRDGGTGAVYVLLRTSR